MTHQINHLNLKVTRTAHYSTYGRLSKETQYIWIVLHGYGQLASNSIKKFGVLDAEKHFVVAPEGLNRFYWHSNNEPVACWMTKQDRYDEINDFVSYLDTIYSKYCAHVNQERVKIVLFGFSQGCATLWRWIHASRPRYQILVNWAGWIPEDISYLHLKEYLSDKKQYLYYGDEDKYLTEATMDGIRKVIKKNELNVSIHQFEGEHKIPKEELIAFNKKYVET